MNSKETYLQPESQVMMLLLSKVFFQNIKETHNDPAVQKDKPAFREAKKSGGSELEQCTHCGRTGHKAEGCFKRIGYPDWWPGKAKKEKERPRAALAESGTIPIPGLTEEQYQTFIKHFSSSVTTRNKDSVEANAHMAGKANEPDPWVVDTGATDHMACDDELL